MKKRIGKFFNAVFCALVAYYAYGFFGDISIKYTVGFFFGIGIGAFSFGAIMFLIECITGKDIETG